LIKVFGDVRPWYTSCYPFSSRAGVYTKEIKGQEIRAVPKCYLKFPGWNDLFMKLQSEVGFGMRFLGHHVILHLTINLLA
jgi:hypothetical protein